MWIILGLAFIFFVFVWWADADLSSGIGGAIVGGFIGFIIALFLGAILDPKHIEVDKWTLQNVVDNTETRGSFFLGTGTVEGYPVYSFYRETDVNTYERYDVDADEAEIHYVEEGVTPYYTRTYDAQTGGFWHDWYVNAGCSCYRESYDFYIPRGSITNEYRLDAE